MLHILGSQHQHFYNRRKVQSHTSIPIVTGLPNHIRPNLVSSKYNSSKKISSLSICEKENQKIDEEDEFEKNIYRYYMFGSCDEDDRSSDTLSLRINGEYSTRNKVRNKFNSINNTENYPLEDDYSNNLSNQYYWDMNFINNMPDISFLNFSILGYVSDNMDNFPLDPLCMEGTNFLQPALMLNDAYSDSGYDVENQSLQIDS
jgi:hypothetical protein